MLIYYINRAEGMKVLGSVMIFYGKTIVFL